MDELRSTGGLQAALVEHGPQLVAFVLTALLAIQAGYLVTAQNLGGRTSSASLASPAANPPAPPLRIESIAAAHMFGDAHGANLDANAPQTNVQLVLTGVLAVPDPKRGLAIVGPSSGAGRLFTVGSALPGGVSLYAVYPDRVLIDRGGMIESLALPRRPLAAYSAPSTANAGQSPAQRLAALAQGNGALLGGLVRAQAVFAGGKLTGYRIFPGGRASLSSFTQLGLRPGDLVTAVNGTALDDPNRANEILQTLSSAASANLTVQRNGQSQDLNLNLETVVNDAESAAAQAAAAQLHGGAFGGPLGGGNGFSGLRGSVSAPGIGVGDEGSDSAPPPDPEPDDSPPPEE